MMLWRLVRMDKIQRLILHGINRILAHNLSCDFDRNIYDEINRELEKGNSKEPCCKMGAKCEDGEKHE